MEANDLVSIASFGVPSHRNTPSQWAFQIPFAFWLIDAARPRVFVQLGTRALDSYFAFCQAVHRSTLGTRCLAVDTGRDDESSTSVREILDRSLFDRINLEYQAFSTLLETTSEETRVGFPDGTVDLLHFHGQPGRDPTAREFEAWLPKMSERGLVLLDNTAVGRGEPGSGRLVRELAARFPTFEFSHGNGLAIIAVGGCIPEKLQRLLMSDESDPIRKEARNLYAMLGQALVDSLVRQERERVGKNVENEIGELRTQLLDAKQAQASLRAEKTKLGVELKQTQQKIRTLLEDNVDLGKKKANLLNQLKEIEGSLGWMLVQKIRTIQAKVLREGTIRGRCWYLFSRFIKTASKSGLNVAVSKTFDKVAGKLYKSLGRNHGSSTAFLARVFPAKVAGDRFQELPWRYLGNRTRSSSRGRGYFKLLLVSHSACRTGAPLCLLRLAEELSRLPDFECWIVLQQGGELEDSFARLAPTLDIERLVEQGVSLHDIPDLIASTFHDFSSRGIAVCNTLATNAFHEALAERKVPVLSWLHELPTFIESLGGFPAIERIKAASRKIMVPAEVVRGALISKFSIDPDCIRTVYNGQDPKTRGMVRETVRLQVRHELGLPADALIVLGCGTVDLRKGADLFVNLTRKLLGDPLAEGLATKTWFIWVGHCFDGAFLRWLLHDIGIGELDDRIRYIGPRENTAPYFLAADVFGLTSREDPCPLVNFEAMESGLAVVAFLGAGGAPEVLGGGGISVPYLDVDAMSQAVLALLADPVRREEMGRRGQNLIRERFTWSRFMDEFLDILKTDFQYRPARSLKVSVIVPNYRHEPYLEERLRSIFRQTLKPHEIIFLDDASPDESVEVARRLAAEAPVPMRIVVNEQNSGSTFRQWMKGLSLASGDLVWLAESDDSCHPEFLERLVPEFYDPDVALAYCQSALIGPRRERWSDDFLGHTDDISKSRWRSRYSVSGIVEAEEALSQKNTIPNASAVVFRRPQCLDFVQELEKLRFAGDWLFYAMLIRSGKIVYLPEVLNEYRRHEQTVTHQSIRGETHAQETLLVKARIFETFNVPANAIAQSLGRSVLEYNQLSERSDLRRPTLTANPHLATVLSRIRSTLQKGRASDDALKILLVVRDMVPGAESLANIHLANALAREHLVFLCNAQPSKCHLNLVQQLEDRVILLEGTLGETAWSLDIDGLAEGGRAHSGRRGQILEELIRFHRIDVIHSRSWWADRLVLGLDRELKLPWLIHLDGCDHPLIHQERADPGSARVAADLVSSARGIFYEHQCEKDLLDQRTDLSLNRLIRVSRGFDPQCLVRSEDQSAQHQYESFRFLLIQSGLAGDREAKDAIEAVRVVNALLANDGASRQAHLVLFADGSAAGSIEAVLSFDDQVELHREPINPIAALTQCDAILIPHDSTKGETTSLVIAALAFGRPVLTLEHGAFHEMIASEGRHAGILLPNQGESKADLDQLVAAMRTYLIKPKLYDSHRQTAVSIFNERYAIDRIAATCTEAYIEACNVLAFPRVALPYETPTIPSRRLA